MTAHDEHSISTRTYFLVFTALLVLTGVTVVAAFFNFGHLNDIIALVIAGTKATLVILFFMHVWHASGLTRVFVLSGFAWLALLMAFTFADLFTRWQVEAAG
ncbi:MAG TPA: cytochrome C oxidase subunit IV family protein [Phycisphaerae bacterium]|jgi:cytochrome c oxidase subunit 4|nr:hypothetical protein [Phycisphaerae bacterium]HOB73836.1 cytochrome C oxidase subunit IV family protein [Phycisphaerae bacterium]HOJ53949.1 cytochrome C oxidase subunit IV family protein [Phycisphaerae bacterium]HOL27546.1 cytochrome C oxidase subunit IV family protein [Phycisphaerae bacterium]HPP22571.1 cytochrome C oxidase subunit IV family protein [Phycisphaerae bacterium]